MIAKGGVYDPCDKGALNLVSLVKGGFMVRRSYSHSPVPRSRMLSSRLLAGAAVAHGRVAGVEQGQRPLDDFKKLDRATTCPRCCYFMRP